jgi:hypothetical protein
MTFLSKVGSFNIDTTKTANQTQAISGVGFQPKIVLFFGGGSVQTGDSVQGGNAQMAFGAGISSSSMVVVNAATADGAVGSSKNISEQYPDLYVTRHQTSPVDGNIDGQLALSTMDADGFTVKYTRVYAQAFRISWLALAGTELTNVFIGNRATPTSTGNYSTTGVGFQPDAMIVCAMPSSNLNAEDAHFNMTLGFATGASNQGVVIGFSQASQATSVTRGYGYDGEIMAYRNPYGAIDMRESFVSFDADGFTFNHLEGTVAKYYYYICLKGGQYHVGSLTTRTDGNDIVVTDPAFTPAAILFASANRALSTQDTQTNNNRLSFGAATSATNRACAAMSDENGLGTTETANANYDTAIYANVVDDVLAGQMDIKSIDANGFTAVMDDTDPSECWVNYLAMGSAETTFSLIRGFKHRSA